MKNQNAYYNQPLYAVFKRENGVLWGYVEHSFQMGWDRKYVRVWTKHDIKHLKKANDIKNGEFIVRVRSKKSNVNIILEDLYPYPQTRKFEFRNKRFEEIKV